MLVTLYKNMFQNNPKYKICRETIDARFSSIIEQARKARYGSYSVLRAADRL